MSVSLIEHIGCITYPLRLVAPQPHDLGGRGDAVVGGEEEPLEDVGEVAQVEDVVELESSR